MKLTIYFNFIPKKVRKDPDTNRDITLLGGIYVHT